MSGSMDLIASGSSGCDRVGAAAGKFKMMAGFKFKGVVRVLAHDLYV